MKSKEQSILNPNTEKIKEYVDSFEDEWGFSEFIYTRCILEAEKIELFEIEEKDIKGPIRTFLVNWGLMARVTGRLKKEDWGKLENKLQNICNTLDKFKKSKLEECKESDIYKWESEIKKCYETLDEIENIGPTSISKILHLLCPNFFPLLDDAIRGKSGIAGSSEGYYKFMIGIKKFLKKYDSTISELTNNYRKPKLKIIDEFMFCFAHPERCF